MKNTIERPIMLPFVDCDGFFRASADVDDSLAAEHFAQVDDEGLHAGGYLVEAALHHFHHEFVRLRLRSQVLRREQVGQNAKR